jgi:hypothetical protein
MTQMKPPPENPGRFSFSMGNENKPLRPNYIWQQESGQFYTAKSIPTEWKAGKATATITEIGFGPNS